MITSAQYTIVDMLDPIQQGSAPSNPTIDMLWIDTSVNPNTLKRWNGTEWVVINDADVSALEERITTCETEISEQADQIALRATKEELVTLDGEVKRVTNYAAEIDAKADEISSIVARKSYNYRQEQMPVAANAGDIWVRPSDGKQFQAVGAIGKDAPIFGWNDEGQLVYYYSDDASVQYPLKIDEDGNLLIQTDHNDEYTIVNDEFVGTGAWVEIISQEFSALVQRVDGITTTVSNLNGDISNVSQKADRIDWVISDQSQSATNMTLTSKMASLITGEIDAYADNINLTGNTSIRITSGDQISADARREMDLSANDSIVIYSGGQISVDAREEMDLSANETIKIKSGDQIEQEALGSITSTVIGSSAMDSKLSAYTKTEQLDDMFAVYIASELPSVSRNLILRSDIERIHEGNGYFIQDYILSDYGNYLFIGYGKKIRQGEIQNFKATISYDAKSTVVGNMITFWLGNLFIERTVSDTGIEETTHEGPLTDWFDDILTNEYVHYSHTLTFNNWNDEEGIPNFPILKIYESVNQGIISIKNIKLEYGDKETRWSAAPEDTDNDILSVKSKVDNVYNNVQQTNQYLERIVRIQEDGLHVGDNHNSGEVLIDSNSVNIVTNNQKVSTFAENYIRLGNMLIRQPSIGGLTIQVIDAK